MRCPSISVVNCGKLFNSAWAADQSYPVRQYSASSRSQATGTPVSQSSPGRAAGQRVRSSRLRRSSISQDGTSMLKGMISAVMTRR
jgi:hypothetical protein